MTDKLTRLIKMSAFIMLLSLVLMACEPGTGISVEQSVAQTVEAAEAVALQVKLTVEAQAAQVKLTAEAEALQMQQTADAQALQVKQTVDAQLAAMQSSAEAAAEPPAGGDVADPNANIPASQPVVDPNLAAGTPQLRVTASSVNVRSGPGTNYPVVTTLRQDAVVVAAAKNQAGTWFLIDLPGGAKGWISKSVTAPLVEADMVKVSVAVTIPVPPPTVVPATATATTAAIAATHTPQAATATATAAATATMPPMPTQLTKNSWQVDFLFLGGSDRLQVSFTQNGGVLSGSNRDNNAELDIVTTGSVTGDTVVVTFTLSNGGSLRGSVTCTGTIDAGPPQTISGTFTALTMDGVGATEGSCSFR